MKTIPGLVAIAIACATCTKSGGAPEAQKSPPRAGEAPVAIKVTPVAGAVHLLEGRGGNIGVSVGEDGILLVDDQFADIAPAIRRALAELRAGPVSFVLNTHWHGDHTGGNPVFGREATIVAHENVRARVSAAQHVRDHTVAPLAKEGWPVVTFRDSVTIHFNGEPIDIVHFPTGHTDGDSIVFFRRSNTVHAGDHFFSGRFPFVDLETGGNALGLAKNVARLLEMVDEGTKIIPGHGPLAGKAELREYHAMLDDTIDLVRRRLAAGKTPEQIGKEGFGAKYSGWGTGYISNEAWAQIVAASLRARE